MLVYTLELQLYLGSLQCCKEDRIHTVSHNYRQSTHPSHQPSALTPVKHIFAQEVSFSQEEGSI
jgi:hypothetical protein